MGWKCYRFDSIQTNRHESFPLLSIRYTESRFERYLENIASQVYTGWVENVVDSTRSERIDTNRFPAIVSFYRKSICKSLRKCSFPGLYKVGWKFCRFDSIRTNRHESFPLLSIRYTESRFERYLENIASQVYTGWVENVVDSTRSQRIDTNRFPAVDSFYRKSICKSLRKCSFPGLYKVGWKFCRFDSIRWNRHESLPLLSNRYAGSRFARVLENIGLYRISGLYRVGWKCCRFDQIDTNRFSCFRFTVAEVDLHENLIT